MARCVFEILPVGHSAVRFVSPSVVFSKGLRDRYIVQVARWCGLLLTSASVPLEQQAHAY
jgi:hypothetical protein